MPPLRFARVESSLGPMLVAQTDRGVAAVGLATTLDIFLEPLRRRFPWPLVRPRRTRRQTLALELTEC